jgi:hypothetical protein
MNDRDLEPGLEKRAKENALVSTKREEEEEERVFALLARPSKK